MELHTEDQNAAAESAETAPVRRRASRRVSAAAGAAADVAADVAVTEAPAAEAPAAEAPAAPAEKAAPKRASRARKKAEPAEAAAEGADAAATTEAPAEEAPAKAAPKTRASRAKAAQATTEAAAPEAAAEAVAEQPAAEQPAEAPKKRATRSRKAPATEAPEASTETPAAEEAPAKDAADAAPAEGKASESAEAAAEQPAAEETEAQPARRSRRRSSQNAEQAEGETPAAADESKSRGRGGNQNGSKGEGAKSDAPKGDAQKAEAEKQGQNDKQGQSDRSDNKQENGSRSSRTRQRDRKRRGGDDLEPEIAEDDVLLPVAGILDVLDNYAFVRTSGYLPGVSDVYVALGQVKKYSLRRGDAIVGAIRQPREGDSGGRQKYNAIVKIDSVNGKPVEETEKRADIAEMTAIFPETPLRFATGTKGLGAEIDAAAPMGLGQRALLALPAEIPAARVLAELAGAVTANAPEAHLLLVLTNARPEEVTHLQRTVSGEVIAATFDRAAEDQATIVELAIDRASRLVELGHDVIVLLDSLTDLAHAAQQNQQGSRTAPDASQALSAAHARRLLGAARNLENAGSLTLLATARTHTGVDADKDLLRALVPAVNSFVKISGTRQAPEVNADKSYTLSF